MFSGLSNRFRRGLRPVTADSALKALVGESLPITNRIIQLTEAPTLFWRQHYSAGFGRALQEKHTKSDHVPIVHATVEFSEDGLTMTVNARIVEPTSGGVVPPPQPARRRQPPLPHLPEGIVDSQEMLDAALVAAARISDSQEGRPVEFSVQPTFLRSLDLASLDERLAALLTERFPALAGMSWTVHANEVGDGLVVDLGRVENPGEDGEGYQPPDEHPL